MSGDLIVRAQAGDQGAFEALVVAHHDRLFRLAHGILRDRQLAEDATQQAFVAIWRELPRLRDPDRFEGWSYRLLVRLCYAEAKRSFGRPLDWETAGPEEPCVRDPFGAVIDRDRLERGFARLSVDQRTVVVMRYLLDMSPEQAASVLGIPRSTVYSRLTRALDALRGALEADERPAGARIDGQERMA